MATYPVYLEVGRRRVFAGALDWPGWCRSGRDEGAALQALLASGPRYATVIGRATGFTAPSGVSALQVVERLEGTSTTDFGAPGVAPTRDRRPLDDAEAERLGALLRACWATFDRAAEAAVGRSLRKGPRGGGRELDAIVRHVLEAEKVYLARLGAKPRQPGDAGRGAEMGRIRAAFLDGVSAHARGERPARSPRSGEPWTPRYAVRRSAWHALDHAWEIEDRRT